MNKYSVKEIPHDSFFTKPVYLDKSFIITAPEMPFSESFANSLVNWGIKEVFSEGELSENYTLDQERDIGTANNAGDEGAAADILPQEETKEMKQAMDFYNSLENYTKTLFTTIYIKNELNLDRMVDYLKPVVSYVRKDYRFIMMIQKEAAPVDDNSYIVAHSARTAIIAIIIGNQLKLPAHKLIELGISAILHELGMLELPPQVHLPKRRLSDKEQNLLKMHPVLGFNKLKAMGVPMGICQAVLEHHERENGTGYPKKLTAEKICLNAKILAVACSYEAITAKRPHRVAKDRYSAMLEILKNEKKQYDDTVIQALVNSLSIYPIGLNVLLSNDKKGMVVDVSPRNPQYPIVQVFDEFTPDGKNKLLQTSPDDIFIARPLTQQETNANNRNSG